jgi:hypothetical protein
MQLDANAAHSPSHISSTGCCLPQSSLSTDSLCSLSSWPRLASTVGGQDWSTVSSSLHSTTPTTILRCYAGSYKHNYVQHRYQQPKRNFTTTKKESTDKQSGEKFPL